LRELVFVFPRVLSNQEGALTKLPPTVFFLARKMSYYGGPELPEGVEPLTATNYKYGADGRPWGRPHQIPGGRIALIAAPDVISEGCASKAGNIGPHESWQDAIGSGAPS
jgi:hypothetical protein